MTKKKGFTIAELLIVVAIIAVLVTVSIPIFAAQLHKAKVAADWANVRAYFSEIQADYVSTGEHNPKVKNDPYGTFDYQTIYYLDGHYVKLNGYFMVHTSTTGYSIVYHCKDYDPDCELSLGT